MKPQSLLIGLSVLALSLVVTIAYVQRPHLPAPTVAKLAETPSPTGAVERAAPPVKPAGLPVAPFSWRNVESDDYHKYIANLRALGCPEQTIRDIILADVNKLYAAREEPLKTKPKPAPDTNAVETAAQTLERLQQLRTVQQEKRWVVKELLGIDLPLDLLPSSGSRDYHAFEVALKSLSPEKRDAVQALQENYWQQSDALKAKYDKKKTPEYTTESRQLTESLRQEIGKLLTPQEQEDYEMRTSSDAKQLSTKLATYFRPSEEEYRKIFRAKRDYEQSIQTLAESAPAAVDVANAGDKNALAQQRALQAQAQQQARAAATSQMNDQLKTALGDDRYTEYQRSQDRTYDLLARLGVRYNLPQEKVVEAYDTQQSFRSIVAAQRDASEPKPVDRAELQRQLNDKLTTILGEQAARGYRRVNGGSVPLK